MFQRNAWASITALCLCSVALCISQASAQEKVLKQYYGNGVHAYYSGNYAEAFDLLSKPINAKIEDPRPYYFRGFALMELGRPDQAEKDFKAGAALEIKDTTGRFPVNFALERCQGKARLALENARNEVLLADFQRRAKYSEAIYNRNLEDQKETLIPDADIDLDNGSTLDLGDGEALLDDGDGNDSGADEIDQPGGNDDIFGGNDDDDDDSDANQTLDNEDGETAIDFGDDNDSPADETEQPGGNDPFSADEDDETPVEDGDNNDGGLLDTDNENPDGATDNEDPFGVEDDNAAEETKDDAADEPKDDAEEDVDPFAVETPEETKEAEPLKNANLDDDAADAADDNADAADAADAADDNADAADAADAADDNADAADAADAADDKADDAEEDDPFDF